MDVTKLIKLLVVTNILTLLLTGLSVYWAYEAWYAADDAYSAASQAQSDASDALDLLRSRR